MGDCNDWQHRLAVKVYKILYFAQTKTYTTAHAANVLATGHILCLELSPLSPLSAKLRSLGKGPIRYKRLKRPNYLALLSLHKPIAMREDDAHAIYHRHVLAAAQKNSYSSANLTLTFVTNVLHLNLLYYRTF